MVTHADLAALSGTSPAMDRLIEEIRHKDAAIRDALRILCAEPFDRNNINDAVVRLTGATTAQQGAEGW